MDTKQMTVEEDRVVALEVKIDYIIKQIDHLVSCQESRDTLIRELTSRLSVIEDRQSNTTKLTVALAAGLPIMLMALAAILGIKI
jgi:hypothetical protein